jgi:hypothetical protein
VIDGRGVVTERERSERRGMFAETWRRAWTPWLV